MAQDFSKVTTKGQLVIPARLRRKFGIRKGTRVALVEEGDRLFLQPVTPDFIRQLRGAARGRPSPLKFLLRERRRERNR